MSIRANTAYNLLGVVLPMGLSLITIPIYIRLIGDARYGVLAVVWAFLGYFSLFDLGLGSATAQRIASMHKSDPGEVGRTFWTALVMNGALGAFGGLLVWPLSVYFFGNFIVMDEHLNSELRSALPYLVFAVPLMTLSGVVVGALQGVSKFRELNVISVASSVLLQALPLCVAWLYGPDLAWLLPAVVFSRLASLVALFCVCKIHVFRNSPPSFSRHQARGLLVFGGWVTISSIFGPLTVIVDRFVIGATLGAKAVTYYAVPFQLAERSTVVPVALMSALSPRLTMASEVEARDLATRAVRSLAAVMTPVMLLAILLVEPFFQLWIGAEFAANVNITAQILLLTYWINGFARVPYAQLQSTGRPDTLAKYHLVEVAPYLFFLFIGLHFWGLPGAATAYCLKAIGDCLFLLYFAHNLTDSIAIIKFPTILMAGSLIVSAFVVVGGPVWWLMVCLLLAISLVWSLKNAPDEMREMVLASTKRLSLGMRAVLR